MKFLRSENCQLDPVDATILRALARDARITMSELAGQVGMSAPSVAERVRRLEESGVVLGYEAIVSPAAMGLPLAAYIRVRPMPGQLSRVVEVLRNLESIVECDRITGEDCFMAKAHVRNIAELEALIDSIIPFATTNTSIIQSSPVKRRLPRVAATSVAPLARRAARKSGIKP